MAFLPDAEASNDGSHEYHSWGSPSLEDLRCQLVRLRLATAGLLVALLLACIALAARELGGCGGEPPQPLLLPAARRPRNAAGRLIPQVLYDEEQRGMNTMLQGAGWEPQDPVPGRQSTKGRLERNSTALLIIDMQPLFYDPTSPWGTPGGLDSSHMRHIWPKQLALAKSLARFTGHSGSTFLTKFLPPARASDAQGVMRHYYREESGVLVDALRAASADVPFLLEVMPPLQPLLALGAHTSTKKTGGAFGPGSTLPAQLDAHFVGAGAATRTLIVTGVETDFCVISTILGALDHYYRVIVATDAISSSQPNAAQAQLDYTLRRFDHMVDLATTDCILSFLA